MDKECSVKNKPEHVHSVCVDLVAEMSKEAISESQLEKKLAKQAKNLPPVSVSVGNKRQLEYANKSQVETFYKQKATVLGPKDAKPWKTDPHYFRTAHVSLQALIKMTLHARMGSPLEIMGMLTGKYIGNELVVMDCFALPVHGTESRVNPANEAYEFMLQYLSELQRSENRSENIIGWYHSHPSFGCWLSGIDVQTQRLNQNFQDPYLAIVVDPEKSVTQKAVEIGCFRAYYEDNKPTDAKNSLSLGQTTAKLSSAKIKDFGFHANDYYSLNIDVFKNADDTRVLDLLGSKFWLNGLCSLRTDDEVLKLQQQQQLVQAVQGELAEIFKNSDEYKLEQDKVAKSGESEAQVAAKHKCAALTRAVGSSAVDELSGYLLRDVQESLFG